PTAATISPMRLSFVDRPAVPARAALFAVPVLHSEVREPGAEPVKVQSELTRAQALARSFFFGHTLRPEARNLAGCRARHHTNTIRVPDDNVAWLNKGASTDDRNVDGACRGFYRALRADGLRADRKVHCGDIGDVADPCVDHDANDAPGA